MPPGPFDRKSEIIFRIKLKSGRVLGPLDLRRIALLIVKNQIVGDEMAMEQAEGEWKRVTAFPPLADLLLAKLEGRLTKRNLFTIEEIVPEAGVGETQVIEDAPPASIPAAVLPVGDSEPTAVVDPSQSIQLEESSKGSGTAEKTIVANAEDKPKAVKIIEKKGEIKRAKEQKIQLETHPHVKGQPMSVEEKPRFDDYANDESDSVGSNDATQAVTRELARKYKKDTAGHRRPLTKREQELEIRALELERANSPSNRIADQKTLLMPALPYDRVESGRPGFPGALGGSRRPPISIGAKLRAAVIGLALGWVVYQAFVVQPDPGPIAKLTRIRPRLPNQSASRDPKRATELYLDGVRYYLLDTIDGYRKASERFLAAAAMDPDSVKALAMLASSYLNLIDASNKDESYFSVISKLIEMSRAKSIDLAETVIADVEYFIMANKPEAAQNRIIEYTRVQRTWPIDMYYYLAYAFYHRGDFQSSARYLISFPDNKANSPKVFYLRGLLAYEKSTKTEALSELLKALKMSPTHAKSRLKICEILAEEGKIQAASPHLQYLIAHPELMTARELAKTFFLFGKLKFYIRNNVEALAEVEKAVSLDRTNSEYLLEMYSLRAKIGESVATSRKKARMYFFMEEGEKALMSGKDQEARTYFLQAREADGTSALPLVRIGDTFVKANDWGSALLNYRKAAELATKSIPIWSKYIQALIQNYEWKEVEKAMEHFRGVPDAESAMDKLYGDMYAKQNLNLEAIAWYKKAMSRETIDPEVYMAFGKALMATRAYASAPLFFALALRFDPLNIEAVIGTANSAAQTDSIERAVRMLQDESQKSRFPRAELYAAIAQLQMQRGDWLSALQSVNQAMEVNPDFPLSYKLRAEIYLNQLQSGGLKGREAKEKLQDTLDSFKSYSDRNLSDPSGYLERFRLLAERARYNEAEEELLKVFGRFPKYPGLHLLKGNLHLVRNQHEEAFTEYELEVKNNPNYVDGLLAIGKEYIFQNRADKAMEVFNKAMKLAPMTSEPKHWAGYANFLLKNYQGAVALYQTALQVDSGNPMIYKRLGLAYKYLGNNAEAGRAFRRYLELAPDAPDRAEFERYQ